MLKCSIIFELTQCSERAMNQVIYILLAVECHKVWSHVNGTIVGKWTYPRWKICSKVVNYIIVSAPQWPN